MTGHGTTRNDTTGYDRTEHDINRYVIIRCNVRGGRDLMHNQTQTDMHRKIHTMKNNVQLYAFHALRQFLVKFFYVRYPRYKN